MKKISVYATAFMAMFLLTACMGNDDDAVDNSDKSSATSADTNDQKADNNTSNTN